MDNSTNKCLQLCNYFYRNSLVSLNIYGNMLSYVNEFLSNRTLQVKINNTFSEIHIVQNGTRQGRQP